MHSCDIEECLRGQHLKSSLKRADSFQAKLLKGLLVALCATVNVLMTFILGKHELIVT